MAEWLFLRGSARGGRWACGLIVILFGLAQCAPHIDVEFMRRLQALAADPESSRCQGFALIGDHWFDGEMWEMLRVHEEGSKNIASHREYFLDEFYAQAVSFILPHLEGAVRDCAGGVATAFANAIPFISRSAGDEAAIRYYDLAVILLQPLRDRAAKGWELLQEAAGTRLMPNLAAMPSLLGRWRRTCGEGALRVHVHNAGRDVGSLRCSTGLRATEVWLHRQIQHSDCATQEADDADRVFLPIHSVCQHIRRNQFRMLHEHSPLIRPYYELSEDNWALIDEVSVALGVGVASIFVVFPEEKWPLLFSAKRRVRPRFLVVEASPLHCTHYDRIRLQWTEDDQPRCYHCLDCFRLGYDIVVPSFVDFYLRDRLLRARRPYHERSWLLVHHGAGGEGSMDGIYTEVINWRWAMQRLAHLPNVSIGAHHVDYMELLGQGRFCLVPKGVGYWTHRLYEAVLAGCIPVILSNHAVLPFQGVLGIDWADFSIKWPEERIGFELYDWLWRLDGISGQRLKSALDRVACWFDYHGPDDCNAFVATMQAMAIGDQTKSSPERFWNIPEFRERDPQGQRLHWLKLRGDYNLTRREVLAGMLEAQEIYGAAMA